MDITEVKNSVREAVLISDSIKTNLKQEPYTKNLVPQTSPAHNGAYQKNIVNYRIIYRQPIK